VWYADGPEEEREREREREVEEIKKIDCCADGNTK
jgi:hypothetical protein